VAPSASGVLKVGDKIVVRACGAFIRKQISVHFASRLPSISLAELHHTTNKVK
jgi:hypothetical protein